MTTVSVVRWRRMAASDLAVVGRIGEVVHPDYPEGPGVFADRLRLYPTGCLVLDGEQGIQGYALAHPWIFGRPPPLDTQLGQLPDRADTFYIHDLAIVSGARGGGVGRKAIDLLTRRARLNAFQSMSLVAVGESAGFWRRNGFEMAEYDATRVDLTTYQGAIFMARVLP